MQLPRLHRWIEEALLRDLSGPCITHQCHEGKEARCHVKWRISSAGIWHQPCRQCYSRPSCCPRWPASTNLLAQILHSREDTRPKVRHYGMLHRRPEAAKRVCNVPQLLLLRQQLLACWRLQHPLELRREACLCGIVALLLECACTQSATRGV